MIYRPFCLSNVSERAMQSADPINPQCVFQTLSPLLPDNCIISADSETSAFWFARNLKIREEMMASLSGNLATMCPAVPYAISAKFEASQDIPDVPFGQFATLLGLKGIRIESPEQIEGALHEVLNADRPAVLDVLCDPNVPITPAHLDFKTLPMFGKALLKGDPEQANLIRQTIKEIMA